MAITAQGLFGKTLQDLLDTTQTAINLDLETHKGALFTNTITPNFDTDTAYGVSPYDANETSGGSWSAGGIALTGTAITLSTGTLKYDATDVSVASSSVTNAMGYLLYADALGGNNAILLIDFGTAVTTSSGTLQIQFDAAGIFTWDYTP